MFVIQTGYFFHSVCLSGEKFWAAKVGIYRYLQRGNYVLLITIFFYFRGRFSRAFLEAQNTIFNLKRTMQTKAKGYALAMSAAACNGMVPLFTLPLISDGLNPISILIFRYLFGVIFLGLMIYFRGHHFRLMKQQVPYVLGLGFFMAIASICLVTSYIHMDGGIANTMLFLYPIWVAVIMAVGFKEKLSWVVYVSMMVALSGVFLLLKAGEGASISTLGLVFILTSSLTYGSYIVLANRPVCRTIPTLKITFYVLFAGLFLFLLIALFGSVGFKSDFATISTPSTWLLWLDCVALAIIPTAVSFLCTTTAVQYIGSTSTAILGAVDPCTAIIIGVSVFAEQLTMRDCFGVFLILFAVTCVIAEGSITSHIVRVTKMFPRRKR